MAITFNVKNMSGAETGATFDIQDAWLESVKGEQAVKDSVVAFMARFRAGTASTKTRGTVNRSGAKPWRQKGNGRARSGEAGSPVWRGGGVAFGPHPRSYEKHVNRKVEKLALRRSFTDRVNEGAVTIVDSIAFESSKTKEMTAMLKNLGLGENVLVLVDDYTENVDLAARNLPNVLVLKASSVNTYLMMLFKKVIVTVAGMEKLGCRLA